MSTCHPLIIKPAKDDTLSWREEKKWKPTREHSPTTNFRVSCLQLFDVSSLVRKRHSVCSLFKKVISVCSMKNKGLRSLPRCVGCCCCCPSLQLNVLLKLSVFLQLRLFHKSSWPDMKMSLNIYIHSLLGVQKKKMSVPYTSRFLLCSKKNDVSEKGKCYIICLFPVSACQSV